MDSLCLTRTFIRRPRVRAACQCQRHGADTAPCTSGPPTSPEQFWGELAEKELFWFQKWSHVFEWNPPFAKWFVGGKTNVSYNCLDRHLTTHRKNKVAILWEGEPGEQRMISYQELHRLVCRFANVLKARGLKAGDRAIIYMGMVPELPIALLACARLGITHSVVFGGFSAEALKARIQDLEAQVVITCDGAWRRGKEVPLKATVDEAVGGVPLRPRCDRLPPHRRRRSTMKDGPRPLVARARRRRRAKPAPPRNSIPSIRSTCSTRPAPRASRRASCTPPADTCCRRT